MSASNDASPGLDAGTLTASCLGVLVAQVGLVLPAAINGVIAQSLHTTGSQLTWVSDAFLVPAATLALTFGVLGDLFGRKRLLVIGSAVMALGFLISSRADSVHLLWLGQAIAGIGAAGAFSCSLALVAAGTRTSRERARGLATWATALSAGALIAPPMSGVIVAHASFRWVFAAGAVLALAATATAALLTRESSNPHGRALDWGGQVTIVGALVSLLYGIIEGPTAGWQSTRILIAFAMAVALFGAFVAIERRTSSPLLRLELFRIPAFSAAAAVAVIGMFAFLGGMYALSIRLGVVQQLSPLRVAGYFVIVQGITPFIWPVLSRLLESWGPRVMLVAGLLCFAAGDFWLAALPITATRLLDSLGPLVLFGVGFGLVVSALTAAAVNVVGPELHGMASAATTLVRDLGQTLGPALIGAVALSHATTLLSRGLPALGLSAKDDAVVHGVLAGGGPVGVLSAPLGPLSAKVAPLAASALSSGYSLGFVVAGSAGLAGALIAGAFLRGAGGPRLEEAPEPTLARSV